MASLDTIYWKKWSLWLWLVAVLSGFIAYLDPSLTADHQRVGHRWGMHFLGLAYLLSLAASFFWGRYEGWFERRASAGTIRAIVLLVMVWFFYMLIVTGGGLLLAGLVSFLWP